MPDDLQKRLEWAIAIVSQDAEPDVIGIAAHVLLSEIERLRACVAELEKPIDMVLHCPACGLQHIDAAETHGLDVGESKSDAPSEWTNPPHRSHLCHGCGHVWRPADVYTNGVAATKTQGKADRNTVMPLAERLEHAEAELSKINKIPAVVDRAGVGDQSVHDAVVAVTGALISAEAEAASLRETLKFIRPYVYGLENIERVDDAID